MWFLCVEQDQLVFFNMVKARSTWDFNSDDNIQIQSTGTRTWYWMRRVKRRVHFEIERSRGCGAQAIHWQGAVNSGRCLPQTHTLRRVARPEDSRSQTTVLRNQQWCLIQLQNVVWGQTQEGIPQSAPIFKGLKGRAKGSRLQDVPDSLVFRTQSQRGPRTCSEKVSCESHVAKDQRGGVAILKTEVWKHMHIFILNISSNMSRQRVARNMVLSQKKSSRRRIGVTTNSPAKGRVEVVQLNCYFKTINWKYLFLTVPDWSLKRVTIGVLYIFCMSLQSWSVFVCCIKLCDTLISHKLYLTVQLVVVWTIML